MEIYTKERWKQDVVFSAKAGQQVSEEVYNEMLNCHPPKNITKDICNSIDKKFDVIIHEGFLMGEPFANNSKGEQLYMTFVKSDFGKGAKCHYVGLYPESPKLAGTFYKFDSDGMGFDGILPVKNYSSDKEAISCAVEHEAYLYKVEYKNGRETSSELLYEPEFM